METILSILLVIFSSIALISCVWIYLSDTYFSAYMWYTGFTPHLDMPNKFRHYCKKHNLLDKSERVSVYAMKQYKFYRIQLPTFICLVVCSILSHIITRYSVMQYGEEFLDRWYIILPELSLIFTIIISLYFILDSHDRDAIDPTKDGEQHAIHWLMRGYTLALIISLFYTL